MSTTSDSEDNTRSMDYDDGDESLDNLSDVESTTKRQRNTLSDRCVICFSDTIDDLVTRPTTAGFQTLAKAAKELKDHVYLTIKPFLDIPTENQTPVMWHRSCHRKYSHTSDRHVKLNAKKLAAQRSSDPSSSLQTTMLDTITCDIDSGVVTRATVDSYDKKICIICQQRKFKGDVKLIKCMTLECSKKLKDAAMFHNDVASLRILGCIDLIAGDAIYHHACSRAYINDHVRCKRRVESSSSSRFQAANEDDSKHAVFYQELLSTVVGDTKVLDMNAVTSLYNRITEKNARNAQVRELLERDMSTAIEFSPPLIRNKSVLVYSKHIQRGSLVQRIIDFVHDNAPEQNSDTTNATHGLHEDHAIFYAATKVRAAILTTGKGIEVGDKVSDTALTNCAEQCVPPEVISLLRYIVDPIAADEVTDNYSSEMNRRLVVSIAQDIVHATTKGRRRMPKHISLACDLYYTFQSERLIQTLNRLGHCDSYDSVKRHMAALADAQSREDIRRSITIPSNIEQYVPGRLIQHVMDNLDFREETLYGHTTHVTSQIIIQKATRCSRDVIMISSSPSRSRTIQESRQIHLNMDQRLIRLPKVFHVKSFVNQVNDDWYHANMPVTKAAERLDLAWAVSRNVQSTSAKDSVEQLTIPSWKAFNMAVATIEDNCRTDTVGYIPLYDSSSQDVSTIRSLMIQAQERTKELCQPECVVACDLGIYQIARKLKEVEPDLFKQTVVRVGVFHLHMKFLEIIGDRYGKAGLEELLSRSGLYGENTVKMIILGKAYNKAVRSAKLMYEVCFRLIFAEFSKEAENIAFVNNMTQAALVFNNSFNTDDRKESFEQLCAECQQLSDKLADYVAKKKLISSTFMFWAELWHMYGILLRLVRADRECNFKLHLSSVAECLPYVFAFDKQNYARWLSVYLADMNTLEISAPTVYQEMLTGGALSVTGLSGPFNAVSLDMRLEQSLNKHAKGALKGISTNSKARDKFLLTAHRMADMHSAVAHMCGLNDDNNSCKELGRARVVRDELDVRRLIQCLSGKMLNPFTTDGLDLIQISNRHKASEAVQKASAEAQSIGVREMGVFVKERLGTEKKPMSDPIRRNSVATFRTADRKVKVSAKQAKPLKHHGTFSTLFQEKTTIEEALRDELTDDFPESLFRSDGTFIKKDKSILMAALEDEIPDTSRTFPTVNSCDLVVIYDGMALIHSLAKSIQNVGTFGDIANLVLSAMFRLPHEVHAIIAETQKLRIDIVMDMYEECSTKNIEREQRSYRKGKSALSALPTIVSGPEQLCPADFHAFLELSSNKNELIAFLANKMLLDAPSLLRDHQELFIGGGFKGKTMKVTKHSASDIPELHADLEEADQRMMLHMKHAVGVGNRKYGLFIATDTDIAVTAISSFDLLGPCEVYQCINSRLVPLHVIYNQLGPLKARALVAFHCITGCDTTSHLSCRKSKKTLWAQVCKNPETLAGMASFGQTSITPREIPQWLVEFIVAAYGCHSSITDLTTARISLFKTLTKKKLDADINRCLPPTAKVLIPHLQRAALQTFISRQCCTPPPVHVPDAINFGWRRDGTMLVPVTISEPETNDLNQDVTNLSDEDKSSASDDDELSSNTDSAAETIPYIDTDNDSDE